MFHNSPYATIPRSRNDYGATTRNDYSATTRNDYGTTSRQWGNSAIAAQNDGPTVQIGASADPVAGNSSSADPVSGNPFVNT